MKRKTHTLNRVSRVESEIVHAIKAQRQLLRYSQIQWARVMGVHQTALSRIESGLQGVSIESLARLVIETKIERWGPITLDYSLCVKLLKTDKSG